MLSFSRSSAFSLSQRIPEPELMEDPRQIDAYEVADFEASDNAFIDQFALRFGTLPKGRMLDIGCGPGGLTRRWALRHPDLMIAAIDGSLNMIHHASATTDPRIENISWHNTLIPLEGFHARHLKDFDVVVCAGTLHHLRDPQTLWREVARLCKPGGRVLISDLVRPPNTHEVEKLVERYGQTHNTPLAPILKRDFRNSLCAAYSVEEVTRQLEECQLPWLTVERTSDRHLLVWGTRP